MDKTNKTTNETSFRSNGELEPSTGSGWTDVHVHLQDKRYGNDVGLVLNRAKKNGVERAVCSATSPADFREVADLGKQFSQILTTFGVHPWFLRGIDGDWERYLESSLYSVPKCGICPAMGEIGLDFAMKEKNESRQEDFFRRQLKIAEKLQIPIVVHSVRATDRILAILSEFSAFPSILFHGFVGTQSQIDRIVERNGYFSFSIRNLRSQNQTAIETILQTPLDRVLLESDGPLLFPSKDVFGSNPPTMIEELGEDGFLLNEPALIPIVAEEIQKRRKISAEEFRRQILENERRFFATWKSFDRSSEPVDRR